MGIRVRNPFSVAFVCGHFQEAITSQHIFEPILARNHSHVISVEDALPGLMKRRDMPKSMLEPEADGQQRQLQLHKQPRQQQLHQQQLLLQAPITTTHHLVFPNPNRILDISCCPIEHLFRLSKMLPSIKIILSEVS